MCFLRAFVAWAVSLDERSGRELFAARPLVGACARGGRQRPRRRRAAVEALPAPSPCSNSLTALSCVYLRASLTAVARNRAKGPVATCTVQELRVLSCAKVPGPTRQDFSVFLELSFGLES